MQRAKSLASKLNHHLDLSQVDESLLPLVLCLAFPDRIAQSRSATGCISSCQWPWKSEVRDDDPLANNEYIVVIDRCVRQGEQVRSFSDTDWYSAAWGFIPSGLFTREDYADWDEKRGRLLAEERVLLGKLDYQH